MQPTPQEPKFITKLSWLQKAAASIAVTMFFVVWMMGWSFVVLIFKPDFVGLLTRLRIGAMVTGIILTSFVGYHQIKVMLSWAFDNYKLYQKFKETQDKE